MRPATVEQHAVHLSPQDELVSGIYAAAAGRQGWDKPLAAIARQLGMRVAQVVRVEERKGMLATSVWGACAPSCPASSHVRRCDDLAPWLVPAMTLKLGEWMHCQERDDQNPLAAAPSCQPPVQAREVRHLSCAKLLEEDHGIYLLVLRRGAGRPWGAIQTEGLQSICHHLSEALRNRVVMRRVRAHMDTAAVLMARFRYPLLLLDGHRNILDCSPEAQAILDDAQVLCERDGVLTCRSPAANGELLQATQALLAGSRRPSRCVVSLARPQGGPMNLVISTVQQEQSPLALAPSPQMVVLVHEPAKEAATPDAAMVADCFSLTPAEARVAVQLAKGRAAKEIASLHRTSLPTVRSQIQSILLKTGVSRQSDLIRLLLGAPG